MRATSWEFDSPYPHKNTETNADLHIQRRVRGACFRILNKNKSKKIKNKYVETKQREPIPN